uniref:C6 domain-containing protein n=1 Tax=Acrobeloides nanus TaxID=290746 RepID=A0A914E3X2_9BILA
MSECSSNEVLIKNKCYPKRNESQSCTYSEQCSHNCNETSPYHCIDKICQLNISSIDFSTREIRRYRPRQTLKQTDRDTMDSQQIQKRLQGYFAPEFSSLFSSSSNILCPDSRLPPQMINGVVLECIKRPCGKDYRCVFSNGKYICCPINGAGGARGRPGSVKSISGLSIANYGYNADPYAYLGLPASLPTGSMCSTKTCTQCNGNCGCFNEIQNEYLCCPQPLYQDSLNFGFLQWTIAITLSPISRNCVPPSYGYCYCPSVKIVASIIPILPITTTTANPNLCCTCTLSSLVLTQGTLVGEMPTISGGCNTAACSVTVVCDGSSVANTIVLMEFNFGNNGGPAVGNQQATVTATLSCSNGLWYYTENGVTRNINQVQCTSTVSNPCQTCNTSQLTLTQGTQVGEMPTASALMTETNGCTSVNIVCDASSVARAIVLMTFNNGNLGGPLANQMATVVAHLICANGVWTFTQNGITMTITEVSCLSTACGSCALNSITLATPNAANSELQATIPSGCTAGTVTGSSASVTIVCQNPIATEGVAVSFNDPNGVAFLLAGAIGTETMTVDCINGVWQFMGNTVSSVVCLDLNPGTLAVLSKKSDRYRNLTSNWLEKTTTMISVTSDCYIDDLLWWDGTDMKETPSIRYYKNQTIEVTCTSNNPTNGSVFMEFNKIGATPFHPQPNMMPVVRAMLQCIDQNWHYKNDEMNEIVAQVSCIQKDSLMLRRNPKKKPRTEILENGSRIYNSTMNLQKYYKTTKIVPNTTSVTIFAYKQNIKGIRTTKFIQNKPKFTPTTTMPMIVTKQKIEIPDIHLVTYNNKHKSTTKSYDALMRQKKKMPYIYYVTKENMGYASHNTTLKPTMPVRIPNVVPDLRADQVESTTKWPKFSPQRVNVVKKNKQKVTDTTGIWSVFDNIVKIFLLWF